MHEIFRWGLIGPGTIARKFAAAVQCIDGIELYAVASRSEEKAQSFADEFGIKRAYGSYDALLEDELVDAVYVSTTNPHHYDCIKRCLFAGKHVLCEKPLALNDNQAIELLQLAKKRNLFVMEGMWTRCLPVFSQVDKWIQDGRIGEIRTIHANFCFEMLGKPDCRQLNLQQGGGALLDAGVYNLMLCIKYLGNSPKKVMAIPEFYKTAVDVTETMILEYPEGRTAVLTSSVGMNLPNDAVIYGTKGFIKIPMYWCGRSATLTQYGASIFAPMTSEHSDCAYPSSGFQYEIEESVRCIRNGLTESPLIPHADTIAAQKIMTRLRQEWGMRYPGNMYE